MHAVECGATWKAASVAAASRHRRSSSVQRAAVRPSGRGTQARRASHSANSRRCVCECAIRSSLNFNIKARLAVCHCMQHQPLRQQPPLRPRVRNRGRCHESCHYSW